MRMDIDEQKRDYFDRIIDCGRHRRDSCRHCDSYVQWLHGEGTASRCQDCIRATESFSGDAKSRERGYSTNITELRTTWGAPGATAGDYAITMVATSITYTGTATPNTSRQSSDGWLSINQDGVKADQAGKFYPDPRCKWRK